MTFLFTDIEGSTRLWDRHADVMPAALARHDEVVRRVVAAHGGYVFATGGDGFCVAFARALDAVRVALEVQRELRAATWPGDLEVRVRMGLNTGEAAERDGDYYGAAVNRAARVMDVARGGQVALSAAAAALVDGALPSGVRLVSAGVHRLRGFERDEQVFLLGLPGDAIGVEQLRARSLGNLPAPLTSFVGRALEVKRLAADLPQRRVVTLTGVGGVGKTRLAIEAAWAARDAFDDGVWLVELAPVAEPDAVVHALASALRVDPQPGVDLASAVVGALVGRRLLLVVDNCEHVLDATHRLVTRIVTACPSVSVLATSREPLGVDGERTVPVRSLDPHLEAVELFCDRALATDGGFAPSDAEAAVIEDICVRLDGIPLAVELAAARTRTMSIGDIHRRLHDRFRLLRGSARGVERHQTLRAAVDWSYQLLTPVERLVFDRCAVFAGSFDEPAAADVCSGDDLEPDDVFDLLDSLVDKNMLSADRSGSQTRYRQLETLRQYGEEQLGADADRCRTRHLHCYVRVAATLDQRMHGRDLADGIAGFHAELDNLRAAVQWALATRDPVAERLVRHLHAYAQIANVPEAGRWVVQIAADLAPPTPFVYGPAAFMVLNIESDLERAIELARRGIDRASGDDDPETADCWAAWGCAAWIGGDSSFGRRAMERSLPLFEAAGDPVHAVMMLYVLAHVQQPDEASTSAAEATVRAGELASTIADISAALAVAAAARRRGELRQAVEAALPWFDQLADLGVRGNLRNGFATVIALALLEDESTWDEAGDFLADALRTFRIDRNDGGLVTVLWECSVLLAVLGAVEPAAVLTGHLDAFGFRPADVTTLHAQRDAVLAADPVTDRWRARGRTITRDEATALALDALADAAARTRRPGATPP